MGNFASNFFSSNMGQLLAIDMGIQWTGWIASSILKTEKFYDLTGSATFILLSYLSNEWGNKSPRSVIQSNMVMAWACRLGMYLFTRILKDGKDKRFDKARENPSVLFVYWTIQGMWVFITLLPTLMMNQETRVRPIGTQDYIGWGLWGLGFVIEVVADFQKTMFRNLPANEGKFIKSGLWSISRHPNYFGEIMLWFGLYISASSVFRGNQYFAVLSPIFVHLLITRLSGIPLLEKAALKKWGNLPEYQEYLKNTPVLVPFLNW